MQFVSCRQKQDNLSNVKLSKLIGHNFLFSLQAAEAFLEQSRTFLVGFFL